MSRRLFFLMTALLMTLAFAVAHAQDSTPGEPVFALSEAQINDEFTIPETATRTISNLVVDVRQGEVHISFEMTSIQDGTSNTMSIIAILIGLAQGNQWESKNAIITSLSAPPRVEREIHQLVSRAWQNYTRSALAEAGDFRIMSKLIEEEGISYF